MLIRLKEIESEEALREALLHPARVEDGVLYVTPDARIAQALAKADLPCIFLEDGRQQGVYGVDLVIAQGEDDGFARCGRARPDAAPEGQMEARDMWRADQELLLSVWKRHYGIPWEIASTERLLIRETVLEDLPRLLALYDQERGNPDVAPFSDRPEEELAAYIQNRYPFYGYGLWTVVEKSTGQVAGRVGFSETRVPADHADAYGSAGKTVPELSYLIARECRRKGYAREAAKAVLSYGRTRLGFARAALRTSAGNTASRRLAVSLGFREKNGFPNFFEIDLTDR